MNLITGIISVIVLIVFWLNFLRERFFLKNGAEGVFVAIIPEKKSALAVKIADGTPRAAEAAIAGLVSELKIIDDDKLEQLISRPVKNSADQIIGHIKFVI